MLRSLLLVVLLGGLGTFVTDVGAHCKPIFFVGGAKCGSTTLAILLKFKEGTDHTDPAGPFDR